MSVELFLAIAVLSGLTSIAAGLYPQESESRIVIDLGGVWNFRVSSSPNQGFDEKWYMQALSEVPHSTLEICKNYPDNSVSL